MLRAEAGVGVGAEPLELAELPVVPLELAELPVVPLELAELPVPA